MNKIAINIMTCKTNKHIIQLAIFLIISFAILMPVVVQAQTKIYKEYEHRTDLTAMCILNFNRSKKKLMKGSYRIVNRDLFF